MVLAGVEGTVGGDAADLWLWRDQIQNFWLNRRIIHFTGNELRCRYIQGFLINPDLYPAPDPALGASILAGVPFAWAFDLGACPVHRLVQ